MTASPGPSVESRKKLYQEACEYLQQVFAAVRNRQRFSLDAGFEIVSRMTDGPSDQDPLFILALHRDERLKFAQHHSVNVAVYAVKMAQCLGFEIERQRQIGMAGLLHDVGIALIPENIVYKSAALTQKEFAVLKDRPNAACKILECFGPEYAYLAETAAQVYERIDGSGYPRGLRADEIHPFAQIVGLLDMYEALVHSRPNRDKISFFDAVKFIFKSCKTQFTRHYMKALLGLFTVFPIHSCVRLNSGAIGRVIETHPEQPMRPKVKILFDSQRRRVLTERNVGLSETPLLNVVACISEAEIKEFLRGVNAAEAPAPESCPEIAEPVV